MVIPQFSRYIDMAVFISVRLICAHLAKFSSKLTIFNPIQMLLNK